MGLAGAVLATSVGCGLFHRRSSDAETEPITPEGLYAKGMAALQERKLRQALDYFDGITFRAESRAEFEPQVRIAIADATFWQRDDLSLIDARSKYLDFVTLYAEHPLAPYAQLQAGVASLQQVNDPSRDQSQTAIAIDDLREVTRRWPGSPWAEAAGQMLVGAEANLARHEYLVGRFYYRNKAYLAATARLQGLLEKYPDYPKRDEVYLLLGESLMLGNNHLEGRIYLDKVVAEYPDSHSAAEARKFLAELPPPAEPEPAPNQDVDGASRSANGGGGQR